MASHGREHGAAIETCVAAARVARQHRIEACKRFLRAIERAQRVCAVEQGLQIARSRGKRLIEALQSLGIPLERVQYVGDVDQRVGGVRVYLQRCRHQPIGFAHLAALRLDQSEQMQRIEIVRRGLERARVELLGIAQAPLLMQAHRLLQGLRNIEGL